MSGETTAVWVSMSLTDNDTIENIRDTLHEEIASPMYDRELSPHISLHPGFSVHTNHIDATKSLISCYADQLSGQSVTLTGPTFFPSLENPAVVKLDADIDLTDIRENLAMFIDGLNNTVIHNPVPPHVTLMKTGDANSGLYGPGEKVKEHLLSTDKHEYRVETTIENIKVKTMTNSKE